jgi:hypothetical protein
MIFINKRKQLFEEIDDLDRFDLIYFDAFGYQTGIMEYCNIQKMYDALKTMAY